MALTGQLGKADSQLGHIELGAVRAVRTPLGRLVDCASVERLAAERQEHAGTTLNDPPRRPT